MLGRYDEALDILFSCQKVQKKKRKYSDFQIIELIADIFATTGKN